MRAPKDAISGAMLATALVLAVVLTTAEEGVITAFFGAWLTATWIANFLGNLVVVVLAGTLIWQLQDRWTRVRLRAERQWDMERDVFRSLVQLAARYATHSVVWKHVTEESPLRARLTDRALDELMFLAQATASARAEVELVFGSKDPEGAMEAQALLSQVHDVLSVKSADAGDYKTAAAKVKQAAHKVQEMMSVEIDS